MGNFARGNTGLWRPDSLDEAKAAFEAGAHAQSPLSAIAHKNGSGRVLLLMTQLRHWLCTAAMAFSPYQSTHFSEYYAVY